MKNLLLILVALLAVTGAYAHEGHDSTPGAIQAPNGGIVEPFKALYIEKVVESTGVKLYPLTHETQPIALKDLKVDASYTLPKGKKQALKLTEEGDHYIAKVDAKGAYKYSLELKVSYQGKSETKVLQIEPQQ